MTCRLPKELLVRPGAGPLDYKLVGIARHDGQTKMSGHWIATRSTSHGPGWALIDSRYRDPANIRLQEPWQVRGFRLLQRQQSGTGTAWLQVSATELHGSCGWTWQYCVTLLRLLQCTPQDACTP